MDDIALDYDPRNAPVSFGVGAFMPGGYGPGSFGAPPLGGMVGPRRPPINYGQTPTRWVAVPARQPAPAPTYPYGYPPGGYYPVPVPVARARWHDLTLGDLLPMLASGITALRGLPTAPTDAEASMVSQTRYLEALAAHFKADTRLNALGTIAGKLVG